ncbi:MAG: filamentous hemagglutinin N-terminal domain-containing protein, partial [Candidatus Margulisiibacteriota bacterium]
LCFLKFDLYSQVIVDSAESKLYLDSTIDGVPIIGINAPDDGISQNKFFEYNVGNRGLIINNSIDYGLSKLGGYILGNSNFKDKEAEHILFDVTGLNISKLEGIQEIVGSKANFILSNPNGLYINGYGFINTNLVRLTTAEPAFTNQGLSYNISKGSITIGEEGLLLDQVSVADLIAKEIRIEGNINFSNPLRLLAGSATIDRISGKVTPIQSESQRIAIDISGDLNAGSIEIISTDEGAGVNSNGSLIFVEDFINISSSGEVTMVTDVVASGSVKINSKDTILSNNNVFAQEHLIVSSNLLNLSSSNVTALDTITFNLNDHISEFSQVISSKVTINADQQVLKSVNIISNSTQIDGDNIRISSESVIVALDRLLMSVDQLYHDSSLISSNMQIIISANNVINMGEITSKLLDIHSKATISNLGTIAGDRMTMVSPTLNNDGYINTRDDLLLNIDQLNQFGLVLSYGDMFISSNVISNFDDGRIFSGRHLNLLSNDFLNFHLSL